MKGVNIFLADGFEDVEALATCDVLRRGGVAVRLVALTDEATVESSHGVTVCPDAFLPEVDLDAAGTTAEDVMIFPGGMPGSKNLAACFDGFEEALIAQGAVHTPAPAVRAGRIVTGRSAGHAVAFGLEILRGLKGDAVASQVRHALYLD